MRQFLAACFLVLLLVPCAHAGSATLVRVIDGDSLVLKVNGTNVEVRLIGIDAPEYRQEWGQAATRFVQSYLRGKTLCIAYGSKRLDRFGRTLAYVYADRTMLNEELIKQGLALPYPIPPNTKHKVRFARAAEAAKKARAGFWKQGGLTLTPRQFRRLK